MSTVYIHNKYMKKITKYCYSARHWLFMMGPPYCYFYKNRM